MQATFVQDGNTIDYTPVGAVAAGEVVVQGAIVGVATMAITAGALGALAVRGVCDVVQAAVTFAVGDAVYWDADGNPYNGEAGTGAATTVPTGNTFMGFALAITEATDLTIRLLLRAVESTSAETYALADLSDVDATLYTAGLILVADGTSKYADVAVSGDATLAATGALTLAADEKNLTFLLADVASGQALPVTSTGHVEIVSTGADTRTLAAPTYIGQMLLLSHKTDGGSCVITCATTINDSANNTITMTDVGEAILLVAKANGANKRWMVVSNDGCTLSTV